MRGAFMHELVRVGSLGIVGEIIKIDKDQAYVQVSRTLRCTGLASCRARSVVCPAATVGAEGQACVSGTESELQVHS